MSQGRGIVAASPTACLGAVSVTASVLPIENRGHCSYICKGAETKFLYLCGTTN